MKVIFLDIDGVLNSTRTCFAFDGYPHDFSEKDLQKFDKVAIGLIKRIQENSGAEICITSSWRLFFKAQDIAKGLGLRVLDTTPQLRYCMRGEEIKFWLNSYPGVETYCIIDDDSDMLPEQSKYFVQTRVSEGLTFADAVRVCNILGCTLDPKREILSEEPDSI